MSDQLPNADQVEILTCKFDLFAVDSQEPYTPTTTFQISELTCSIISVYLLFNANVSVIS